MTVALTRTRTEQAMLAAFEAAEPSLPGADWARKLRRDAIGKFAALGLPHRRIEAWKYTDLRERLDTAPPPANAAIAMTARDLDRALGPLAGLDAHRIVFVNGRHAAALSDKTLPAGVHVDTLAAAFGNSTRGWLCEHLTDELAEAGPVLALTTAFATDGLLMRIDAGSRIERPIHLVFLTTNATAASVAVRNMIRIDAGASAILLESHLAVGAAHHCNAATNVHVESKANLAHIQCLPGSAGAHLGNWRLEIGEGATYRGFQLTAGTALVRNETAVAFSGPDAKFDLSGVFLGRGRDHIDTMLVVDHSTPVCESRELFKGVLDDRARGVFQGKVIVRADAQKTDGKQMAKALMLSEDAEFDSKPELEIYADDVACGHGSTAAEIDPAMLFYLRSRGIPLDEARALLIESFVGEALEKIENEALRAALTEVAVGWLGRPAPEAA